MNKLIDVLAAFEAGKLPSHQQFSQFVDYLNSNILSDLEKQGLSPQGELLAACTRDTLASYQKLGEHKNQDNTLQQALWHLNQATLRDVSANVDVSVDTNMDVDTDEAKEDLKALASSLRTIISIFWTSLSAESTGLFQDFASFTRLSLADAAEIIETQAAHAKEGLRQVEQEVQEDKRDTLGRDKQRLEEEKDPKVAWQHGMDTVKSAGTTVIGATQEGAAKTSEVASKTSTKLQDSFNRMCERAQSDEEYHRSLSTLFDTTHKWISRGFDAASSTASSTTVSQKSSSSQHGALASLIHDPTPEQHIPKALDAFQTLIERFSHASLDKLVSAAHRCVLDIREDKDLSTWFDDFFSYLQKCISESGYYRSDTAKAKRKDLKTRWKAMLDADSDFARKWKADLDELTEETRKFQQGIQGDEDLKRVRVAHERLGDAIESGIVEKTKQAGGQAESAVKALMEQASWFWEDIFKVYVPRLIEQLKDVPIPRTEFKDETSELVLENLDISSINLLPSHVYVRNITDVDILAPAQSSPLPTQTQMGNLLRIRAEAIQLSLKDISFYYKDKSATLTPGEFTGLVSLTLPPKGIDVDLKLRLVPASAKITVAPVSTSASKTSNVTPSSSLTNQAVPASITKTATISQREYYKSFHVIESLSISITDELQLDIKESNHQIFVNTFKPIFTSRFKDAMERVLTAQVKGLIESADSFAYDVSRRAEVMGDTGVPSGVAWSAAVWSGFGRVWKEGFQSLRDSAVRTDFKVTGTGIIVEERHMDMETGLEGKPKAALALGAEPQILSGEKRGPMGTASESLEDRVGAVTGQVAQETGVRQEDLENVGQTVQGAKKDLGGVTEEVKKLVQEGKKEMEGFWDTVGTKRKLEERSEGWQSSAFDVKA
ncbi:hypothetical protein K435DRAFT_798123 [Dendrothele bispora CBS 962.96]|uniref:Uncharacterized protein n=1 Tax=Dendrothele bispora (strain CBS 962.96) TaxID=1314807 RepID=A0A4S8M1J7_DENBC|nr:hypothetical protein K435DRAFT_798123 [Dendrothele bispora CBS 962.96]